jgi:hypothetical protein
MPDFDRAAERFSLDPGYGIDKLRNERHKTLQSGRQT